MDLEEGGFALVTDTPGQLLYEQIWGTHIINQGYGEPSDIGRVQGGGSCVLSEVQGL